MFYLLLQTAAEIPNLPAKLPFVGEPSAIAIGIALIVVSLIVILLIKRVVINTILGALLWGVAAFAFNLQLPLIPSIIAAILFGPAGIGVLIILRFFGGI